MSFFAKLWKAVTQPVVTVLQQSSDVVSHVADFTTDVTSGVANTASAITAPVPLVGSVVGAITDEFVFQNDNLLNIVDDYQATVVDLVDLGHFGVTDLLDPSVNYGDAIVNQAGIYLHDTYINGTISTLTNSVESLFDFG